MLIIFFLFSDSFVPCLGDYSLKISSVTLEDDATFQCQAGASDRVPGIRSQSARLTVQVSPDRPVIVLADFINAPTALQDKQVLSTTAGTKIELTCEAHGGRPAAKVRHRLGSEREKNKQTLIARGHSEKIWISDMSESVFALF